MDDRSSSPMVADEYETHLCFESFHMIFLSILYPNSCKTHNISSKLGFVRFLMKNKCFGKK